METRREMSNHLDHDFEDEEPPTLQEITDEAKVKAREAATTASDFVKRHPLPIAIAVGIAVGGISGRFGAFGRRRLSRTEALHDLLDVDSLRDLVDQAIARGSASSRQAQRYARRTVRGIATSRPLRSLPTREIARSLEGFTDAALQAGRRARDGGYAVEQRLVDMAHDQPMTVGLGTLALAVGAGLLLALGRRSSS